LQWVPQALIHWMFLMNLESSIFRI